MNPSIDSVHQKLARSRGKARGHTCGCGLPAYEWAYQHTDPNPLYSEEGSVYSLDPQNYAPMCRSCHRKLDLEKSLRLKESWEKNRAELTREIQQAGGRAAPHPGSPLDNETAVRMGRAGGTARSKRMREDPDLMRRMQDLATRNLPKGSWVCEECGKISTRSGIGNHQKWSSHSGTYRKG